MTTKLIAVANVLRHQVRKPGKLIAGVLAVVILSGCAQPHNTSKASLQAVESGSNEPVTLDASGLAVGASPVTLAIEPSEQWREIKVDLHRTAADSSIESNEDTSGIVVVRSVSLEFGDEQRRRQPGK